jgi:probable rRNA maturation factor
LALRSVKRRSAEVRFSKRAGVSAAWVRNVVSRTLALEKSSGTVSVLITGDAEIRRLNKRHLGHDYATDVISFWLDPVSAAPGEERMLGDLVVSFEMAKSAAKRLGLAFKEEFARYLVHGTLHLLGYEDERPAKKKIMFRRQEAHLKKILKGK